MRKLQERYLRGGHVVGSKNCWRRSGGQIVGRGSPTWHVLDDDVSLEVGLQTQRHSTHLHEKPRAMHLHAHGVGYPNYPHPPQTTSLPMTLTDTWLPGFQKPLHIAVLLCIPRAKSVLGQQTLQLRDRSR